MMNLKINRFAWILAISWIVLADSAVMAQDGNDALPPPPPDNFDAPPPPPPPPPPEEDQMGEPPPPALPMESSDAPGLGGSSNTGFPSMPSNKKSVVDKKGSDAIEAGRELVNMDFPQLTEIKDIVKAVALWTGKNVILDRNVNGKIQIISPKQVTKEEAYQAFLSALNVLNLTTVETGKVIKILPVRTALKGNLKTYVGASWTPPTDEVITQIVPLKYIDSKKIQSTLSRIVSSNTMIAYEPTNTLIISDSGFKVRRILDIIQMLDVQSQQPQVSIVPIRYSDAKSVADKVKEILGGTDRAGTGGYKVMTDDRSNSVVIFGPPRTINDVKNLVQKFDFAVDDPSRQASIHVRPLDYADAKKLASTLSALASGSTQSGSARPIPTFNPGGTPANQPKRDNSPSAVADLGSGVKITADDSSNSLLITGSRSAYDAINGIIRKLDTRKSQVFVEADILDLGMNNNFKFGTSIFMGAGRADGTGNKQIYGWEAGGMAPLILASGAASGTGTSTSGLVNAKDVAGAFASEMSIAVLAGKSIKVPGLGTFTPGGLIKMLKADGNTRVLSSPHILISNNEEGIFSVGEKFFYRVTDTNLTTGTAVPKIEKEEVALSLNIKPNISYSDYVTMKIEMDADAIAGNDPQSGLPIISKRKTSQNVTVKNGQTVVISGLVQTRDVQRYRKIPILGDIPVIGWLFRNSEIEKLRSNLVIFVTPHIVHGPEDLAAIYKAKIRERDDMMEDMYGWNYESDDFYSRLPSKEAGEYVPTSLDAVESKRSSEQRTQVLKDMGYIEDQALDKLDQSSKGIDTSPLPVPVRDGRMSSGDIPVPASEIPPIENQAPNQIPEGN